MLHRNGSRVGRSLAGRQTKSFQYLLLVSRTFSLSMNLPKGALLRGTTARIRVVARDFEGHTTTLYLSFTR